MLRCAARTSTSAGTRRRGRCTSWGLAGVRRGKAKRTTLREDAAGRPADLVNRQFHAQRPDQLWVCDLTYIRTWAGFAYLALVIDVFSRRILGWALAGHMRTELP
jgi:putative transposase